MKVNFEERVIEITKAEAKRASQYGSPEYHQLLAITTDLPAFRIMIKPVRRNHSTGISYVMMEHYLACHENADVLLKEFDCLRRSGCNYGQIKKWLLQRCPELCEEMAA